LNSWFWTRRQASAFENHGLKNQKIIPNISKKAIPSLKLDAMI